VKIGGCGGGGRENGACAKCLHHGGHNLPFFCYGHINSFVPAAFRIRTKPSWKDFRRLRFQVAALQIFLHRLFAQLLKIHLTK
jgi:hypothetical protein